MITKEMYEIVEVEGGFAFVGNGLYQNIDFIDGGNIPTSERAVELLEIYVEVTNNPSTLEPSKPLLEKIQILEKEITMQNQIIDQLLIDSLMGV